MKWLDSFTFVMKSSVTTLREKIEDPERMLHQLICDMEEELVTVREAVASAIADEIQLSKQVDKARAEVTTWLDRAQAAIQRDDESGAKEALEQKLRCEERLTTLESGYESQSVQVQKLQASYRELEDRIQQARHKRTLLVARLARAESSERINNAIGRAGSSSAFAQFGRLEERVDRAEAMSQAHDRLDGHDPAAEELAARFEAEERRVKLQSEFESLKQQLAGQES
ncbi:MAG: PspA/IM30 family protein [Rhodopirellula sp.]|nr:PspA/IM30 family protein [Rhodopirellula sp.]